MMKHDEPIRLRKRGHRYRLTGFLFVLPGLVFFLVFFLYPILTAIEVSFTRWNLFSPKHFVGFANYIGLFSDQGVLHAFKVSLLFALGVSVSLWIISLLLALLVNNEVKAVGLFRTIYFLPSALSLTVIAIVWAYMYGRLGIINLLIRTVVPHASVPWLSNSRYALLSVVIMMVWTLAGYYMIIFLSGLQAIPLELYEVAKIDGANWWQSLLRITLPLLRPIFLFVSIVSVVASLQAFAPFLLMTSGGPGNSTKVITLKIYNDAFFNQHMGKASAESIVLFAIMIVIALVQFRLLRSERGAR